MSAGFVSQRRSATGIGLALALALAGSAALSLRPAAAQSTAPGASTVVKYGTGTSIDSWETRTFTNPAYSALAYERLLGTKPGTGQIVPSLATEWVQDGDTSLRFTLRDGVVFHDGTPFDSAAVKANIEHLQGDGAGQWAGRFASIVGVETPSPTEVVLQLQDPPYGLVSQFAQLGTEMINPAALADGSYLTVESGTGPFRHVPAESQPGVLEVFDRFADHWSGDQDGPARVEMYFIGDGEARYNALVGGQVNVAYISTDQIPRAESEGFVATTATQSRNQVLFDDLSGQFGDVKVRQAICSALDVQSMSDVQFSGLAPVANQMVSEGSPGYDPSITGYPYDVEKAKALMAEAGNPTVAFTLPSYGGRALLSEVFRDNLAAIGVDVTIEQMTSPQYFSIRGDGTYPVFYVSEATTATVILGPYAHYVTRFTPGGDANPFNTSIPEMDAIVARALELPDGSEEQNAVWQELNRFFNDNALECGFYDSVISVAYNPAELGNVQPISYNPHLINYADITPGNG